ncbi:MAG: ABC transporter ATP-binding protein [Caldimicrobium sp.]
MIRLKIKKRLFGPQGEFLLDVEFETKQAEFLVIFGPSGSGKTTLLRIIAGLEKPDEGFIEVDGKIWYDSKKKINLPPQKRDVGFVFQDYALFPNMNVFENIAYGMKKKDKHKVIELLRLAKMEALKDRRPDTLSGGQKQRVALLRAIAREPKLLLLDEPLSSLDRDIATFLREEIKAFQRRYQIPTLMVSHNIEDAIRLADKILKIENGKIIASGSPREVLFSKNPSSGFILKGILLEKVFRGTDYLLSIAIGTDIVEITISKEVGETLNSGDWVQISGKFFATVREFR